MRALRTAGVAALLLPGALLLLLVIAMTGTAAALLLYRASSTGLGVVDALRWRLALELVRAGLGLPKHARAIAAILRNETGGRPGPWLGDTTLAGGPSIGPGQVYRATAKELGLWKPSPAAAANPLLERAEYEALGSDMRWATSEGLRWAVAVYRSKLRAAAGDVATAIRRYNGSGPMAEAYRDKAVVFASSRWGEGALS